MLKSITVHGARQHNLKNIDVEIPRNTFTVITGRSGSGKSSLAFDTIYAEGQRRYVETLSPYARQFLDQMERPEVDSIDGLSPAISIEQKTTNRSPRSTVGTITEIYDYLRVLFAAIGVPHCPKCGRRMSRPTAGQIFRQLLVAVVTGRAPENERLYSQKLACPDCGTSVPQLEPRSFSFNSPFGACEPCSGLGSKWTFDPVKVIVDPSRPLLDGGLGPAGGSSYMHHALTALALQSKNALARPFAELPRQAETVLVQGLPGKLC